MNFEQLLDGAVHPETGAERNLRVRLCKRALALLDGQQPTKEEM